MHAQGHVCDFLFLKQLLTRCVKVSQTSKILAQMEEITSPSNKVQDNHVIDMYEIYINR